MLTKANWPSEVMEDNHCKMPSSLEPIANEYNNHYTSSMQGRRVEWLLNEGHVMITCDKFRKRFVINVPQLAVIEALDNLTSFIEIFYNNFIHFSKKSFFL